MKRLGHCLLGFVFAALLLLSCRALVSRPEPAEADAPLLPPLQAALRAPSASDAAEDLFDHPLQGMASRRLLPGLSDAPAAPAGVPVRDGNGIPLGQKPYVRTAYTSCRLEETSG